jgi:DNA polymerase IV
VVLIDPAEELPFLHGLPIRALWGVGPATAARLAGLGAETVGDLAAMPEDTLCRVLGTSHGRHVAQLARGVDERPVVADRPAKSIGHEETFAADLHDHGALHGHVVRMADAVCERLREAGVRARTVTVKVRFGDRTTITRSHTVSQATGSPRLVREVAAALLEAVDVGTGVRLLGVSASGLTDAPGAQQLAFDDLGAGTDRLGADHAGDGRGGAESRVAGPDGEELHGPGHGERGPESAWEELEAALAAIRARYGQAAVAPAALLGERGLAVKRRGDTQWGPDAGDEHR